MEIIKIVFIFTAVASTSTARHYSPELSLDPTTANIEESPEVAPTQGSPDPELEFRSLKTSVEVVPHVDNEKLKTFDDRKLIYPSQELHTPLNEQALGNEQPLHMPLNEKALHTPLNEQALHTPLNEQALHTPLNEQALKIDTAELDSYGGHDDLKYLEEEDLNVALRREAPQREEVFTSDEAENAFDNQDEAYLSDEVNPFALQNEEVFRSDSSADVTGGGGGDHRRQDDVNLIDVSPLLPEVAPQNEDVFRSDTSADITDGVSSGGGGGGGGGGRQDDVNVIDDSPFLRDAAQNNEEVFRSDASAYTDHSQDNVQFVDGENPQLRHGLPQNVKILRYLKHYTNQPNNYDEDCICNRPGQGVSVSKIINPEGSNLQRVVVYFYNKKGDSRVHLYIPDVQKQNYLPDLPLEEFDLLQPLDSDHLLNLVVNSPYSVTKKEFKTRPDYTVSKVVQPDIDEYKRVFHQLLFTKPKPYELLIRIIQSKLPRRSRKRLLTFISSLGITWDGLVKQLQNDYDNGEVPDFDQEVLTRPDQVFPSYELPSIEYQPSFEKHTASPVIQVIPSYEVNHSVQVTPGYEDHTFIPYQNEPREDENVLPSNEPDFPIHTLLNNGPKIFSQYEELRPSTELYDEAVNVLPSKNVPVPIYEEEDESLEVEYPEVVPGFEDHGFEKYQEEQPEDVSFPRYPEQNQVHVLPSYERPELLLPQRYVENLRPESTLVNPPYPKRPVYPAGAGNNEGELPTAVTQTLREYSEYPEYITYPTPQDYDFPTPTAVAPSQDPLTAVAPSQDQERPLHPSVTRPVYEPSNPVQYQPKPTTYEDYPQDVERYPTTPGVLPTFDYPESTPTEEYPQEVEKYSTSLPTYNPKSTPFEEHPEEIRAYPTAPVKVMPTFDYPQTSPSDEYPQDVNPYPTKPGALPTFENPQITAKEEYPQNARPYPTRPGVLPTLFEEFLHDYRPSVTFDYPKPNLDEKYEISYPHRPAQYKHLEVPSYDEEDVEYNDDRDERPVQPFDESYNDDTTLTDEYKPNENWKLELLGRPQRPLEFEVSPKVKHSSLVSWQSPQYQVQTEYSKPQRLDLVIKYLKTLRNNPNVQQPGQIDLTLLQKLLHPEVSYEIHTDQLQSPQKVPKRDPVFDKWFEGQVIDLGNKFGEVQLDSLKVLIEGILSDNNLMFTKEGVLINKLGNTLNVGELKLRPILIGNSVDVGIKTLLEDAINKKIKIASDSPYLHGLLVSLGTPPHVLGLVPLGYRPANKLPVLNVADNKPVTGVQQLPGAQVETQVVVSTEGSELKRPGGQVTSTRPVTGHYQQEYELPLQSNVFSWTSPFQTVRYHPKIIRKTFKNVPLDKAGFQNFLAKLKRSGFTNGKVRVIRPRQTSANFGGEYEVNSANEVPLETNLEDLREWFGTNLPKFGNGQVLSDLQRGPLDLTKLNSIHDVVFPSGVPSADYYEREVDPSWWRHKPESDSQFNFARPLSRGGLKRWSSGQLPRFKQSLSVNADFPSFAGDGHLQLKSPGFAKLRSKYNQLDLAKLRGLLSNIPNAVSPKVQVSFANAAELDRAAEAVLSRSANLGVSVSHLNGDLRGVQESMASPQGSVKLQLERADGQVPASVGKDFEFTEYPMEEAYAAADAPEFRIIGGNAATGSGTPLSNKGKSGPIVV